VVRRAPPAADATMVRAAPPAAEPALPGPAPTADPPRAAEAGTGSAPAAAGSPQGDPPAPSRATGGRDPSGHHAGKSPVPRSWADPDFQSQGTRVLSREELAAMAAGGSATGAAARAEGPHLAVLSGKSAGAVLAFDAAAQEWSIGSGDERDLRLADDGISAFHAKISRDGTRWRIIDQMSANGTWVNGDKVTVSFLGNGDRVRFGQVECEVQLVGGGRGAGRKKAGKSTARTWIIAAAAAAVTVGVLAVRSWMG
jgi:hypothetical protein